MNSSTLKLPVCCWHFLPLKKILRLQVFLVFCFLFIYSLDITWVGKGKFLGLQIFIDLSSGGKSFYWKVCELTQINLRFFGLLLCGNYNLPCKYSSWFYNVCLRSSNRSLTCFVRDGMTNMSKIILALVEKTLALLLRRNLFLHIMMTVCRIVHGKKCYGFK